MQESLVIGRTVVSRLRNRLRFRLLRIFAEFLQGVLHESGAPTAYGIFVALPVTGLNNLRFENVSIGVS